MLQEDKETDFVTVELADRDPEAKWDCESILSTYSNIYNHPKLIRKQFNYVLGVWEEGGDEGLYEEREH